MLLCYGFIQSDLHTQYCGQWPQEQFGVKCLRDTTTCWLQWGLNLWPPDPNTKAPAIVQEESKYKYMEYDILDKQFARCKRMNVYGYSLKGSGVNSLMACVHICFSSIHVLEAKQNVQMFGSEIFLPSFTFFENSFRCQETLFHVAMDHPYRRSSRLTVSLFLSLTPILSQKQWSVESNVQ